MVKSSGRTSQRCHETSWESRLLGNHETSYGVTRRVPSEESHGYLHSKKCRRFTVWRWRYLIKNPGKSCTPHSRVSIGPPYVSSEIACGSNHSLRGSGVWEPTKPGLRVLVCAASGDSKVLEDTSRRPERSRPPFRGRVRERRHTRASIGGGTRFVTPRVSTNGTPARVFTAGRAIRGEA